MNLLNLIYSSELLIYIIYFSIFGILLVSFIPNTLIDIKLLGFIISIVVFLFSILLWIYYNNEINNFILIVNVPWMSTYNIYYSLGIDGVSIFFIILTTFLTPICILISWNSINFRKREFVAMLLLVELLLINVFCVLDLIFFYIFFESVLIPMFILIGIWGSRQRKIHAAYQFFFYTLLGSIIMLLGVISIYLEVGSTDLQILAQHNFSKEKQIFLWLAFFCSFAVKIPIIPFHIWLPEAHVEAPTAGSVILAGILLKLGTYGLIRFMIPLFPYAMNYFTPIIFTIAIISIIYSSLTTIRQIDLKKIIAYSSVAHMNYSLLGFFVNNSEGLNGAIYLMLGHGVVSSGLFLCIGILYDRYHTRNILYYGGLVTVMPIFSVFFLILTMANIGFPGTVNFIGEFLILVGVWESNTLVCFFAGTSMVLSAVYAVWLYNRVIFGQFRFNTFNKFADINRREFNLLLPLIILTILMGILPNSFLNTVDLSINNYLYLY